ncbi:putative NBPF family member NBPF5 [Callithrix jacchus]
MCLGSFSPIPCVKSPATNISMVVTATHLFHDRAEMIILEIYQELCYQLAESQQQFEDLKEKFLISRATACSLAKQLKKYDFDEYHLNIQSLERDIYKIGEETMYEEFKLIEELRL